STTHDSTTHQDLVTVQAALSEVGGLLLVSGLGVRIVTGDAAHFIRPLAAAEATAGVHLLDRADKLVFRAGLGRFDEIGEEQAKREPRTVIKIGPAATQNPLLALQMTLPADRLAQLRFQSARIDNGIVEADNLLVAAA